MLLGAQALHPLQLFALVGDVARRTFVVHHVERVPGLRSAVQPEHQHRRGRGRFGDPRAAFVEHRLHAAGVDARQQHVADPQRAVLYQHCRNVTAPFIQRGFDHRALGFPVGIGFQVEEFGFEQHLFEQLVEVDALLGRDLLALVFTAPIFNQVVHGRQFLFDLFRVGSRLVDLVDRENDRDLCGGRMVDRLDGLRHHVVVRGYDDDRHVGHFRPAGTHGRKRFVTRRIEERDAPAVVEFHAVCPDVLRDTARFAGDYVRLADVIQQRRFTVVDVPHHRNDRRPRNGVFVRFVLRVDCFLNLNRNELDFETELFGHHDQRFGVEALVDRNHQPQVHAGRDDVGYADVHHGRQFADRYEFGHLQYAFFFFLAFQLFVHTGRYRFPLVAAVLRRFELRAFGRQTGQGIFDLLLYFFFADFRFHHRFYRFPFPPVLEGAFTGTRRARSAVRRSLRPVVLAGRLVLLLRNVYFVFRNPLAFLPFAVAVLALLLFEGFHVDFPQNLRPRQFGAFARTEQVAFVGGHPLVVGLVLDYDFRLIGRCFRDGFGGLGRSGRCCMGDGGGNRSGRCRRSRGSRSADDRLDSRFGRFLFLHGGRDGSRLRSFRFFLRSRFRRIFLLVVVR